MTNALTRQQPDQPGSDRSHAESRESGLARLFGKCDPIQARDFYAPERRSFRIHGHSTTICLEQAFWQTLEAIAEQEGLEPFGMFEFSRYGLILAGVGVLYFLGPGRYLLPRGKADLSLTQRYQVPKVITEILVEPPSDLINRNVADADIFARHQVTVLGIVRATGESTVLALGPYNRIRADDTLILQGSPEDIVSLSKHNPLKQRASVALGTTRLYSDDVRLVEAVDRVADEDGASVRGPPPLLHLLDHRPHPRHAFRDGRKSHEGGVRPVGH